MFGGFGAGADKERSWEVRDVLFIGILGCCGVLVGGSHRS